MTTTLSHSRSRAFAPLVGAELAASRATPTTKLLLLSATTLAAAACAATFAASGAAGRAFDDALRIRTAMHTSTVSTMILAMVAAIVAVTGDFRNGRIDQLVLSVPIRWAILAAKAVASSAVALLYGTAGSLAGGLTAWVWFRANGETLDLTRSIVWQPLLGVVIAAPLFALIGVGVSAALRHQSGTIGVALGWIFLVEPMAAAGIPAIARWFPLSAALGLTNSPDGGLLAPVAGGLVLAAYALISVAIGAVQLARTDI